jgi:hypothetical protein
MPSKNLVIHAIDCKVHSSGFDAEVIAGILAVGSAAASAFAPITGPVSPAILSALGVAEGDLAVALVDLGAAIDRAGQYPDDLYLNLSNDPRHNKIWPRSQDVSPIRSGQIVRPSGLTVPFSDAIDVNFWDRDDGDGGADDFLGRLSVDTTHTGGIRYQVVAHPEQGNVYVVVYSVEEFVSSPLSTSAALLWYKHLGWQGGTQAIQGPLQVGTGWANFKSVFATNNGVIYAIQPDGKLMWYRHPNYQDGTGGFTSPVEVGTGWQHFKSVFATNDGVIYAIQPDGKLMWYRHPNYLSGAGGFTSPVEVGTGWQHFKSVFATSDGVIYAIQPDGKLMWYRHPNYLSGAGGITGPLQVGTGWQHFKSVFATRSGTIYAIRPDGALLWYYHQGWQQNGGASWAGPVQVGTGWQNFKSAFATSNGIIYGVNP